MGALRVGRYVLFGEIASGGMATVHYGRVTGAASFQRVVAIKRLHPHLAKDTDFSTMFLDEARIAARVHHPNVANILDVVLLPEGELLIVMEYLAGESLSRILRALRDDGDAVPAEIASAIACDALQGLHAAHEATNEHGEPLGIVHRDVSPHNLLVGADGITRVIDFGVAKARGRSHATRDGQVKGKLAYMPPEQLRGQTIDRRCDVYAAGVVLWETLTGQRLFLSDNEGETAINVLERKVVPPSQVSRAPKALDAVVLKALARDPAQRYATARDMATAIEAAVTPASARKVASWIETVAGHVLAQRRQVVSDLERNAREDGGTPSGVEKPSEASQISSVSMTTDAPRTGKRRVAVVVIGVVAAAGVAFGAVKWRGREVPAIATTGSAAASVPVSASATAIASAMTIASTKTSTSTTASTTTTAAVTTNRRHAAHAPAATASSDKPCPVKTFVDSDGIVQFRRECAP